MIVEQLKMILATVGKEPPESTRAALTIIIEELEEDDKFLKACQLLQQRVRDMKALDNANIVDKSIFQEFDHAIEESKKFLSECPFTYDQINQHVKL